MNTTKPPSTESLADQYLLPEHVIDAAFAAGRISDAERSAYRGLRRNWFRSARTVKKLTARQLAFIEKIKHKVAGTTPPVTKEPTLFG